MDQLEKTYQPKSIEQDCYQQWEQAGYFQPQSTTVNNTHNYAIMLPPPNITGYLHMGHGFQQTLMDCLIRYQRMQGHNTLWQGGVDHAGIATQMVVERKLHKEENRTRHELGREAFIDKIWSWKNTSGNAITQQIRRLGASIDWSRERFTMDDDLSSAVNKVFIELYNQGLIYKGKRLVNWDPKLLTAISDLEVINEEEDGSLWHINYPILNADNQPSGDYLTVATTRPETLLGDSAVAVHPDDQRYQQYIGQHIALPLTERTIPIIADDYVDPEFGTGCVKITPAHDFNDYAMGQRHDLPLINILTQEAVLNNSVPAAYIGLERFAARKQILHDLTQLGLLVKTEQHRHKIPRGDRSGVVIEPYLTDQWYMRMQPLAEPAIQAVQNGKIQFVPENWTKTYYQWLENIEDWCISRQLWWGHRIPAWYDQAKNIYVGENEAEIRQKYQLADSIELTQDEDVLDTWFSSALWPFSTLGWPKDTLELKQFYPSSVLITGFDIIFFWVARMIMLGLKFMDDVPFKTVYITGLIRDADGQKMSKSKGNVLDPIDLIDGIDLESLVNKRTEAMMQPQLAKKIEQQTRKDYPDGLAESGCDALRFTYCALASNTRNIRFDTHRLEGYRNFCNKLWNAARYVLMNLNDVVFDNEPVTAIKSQNIADQWIMDRLQATIQQAHSYFAQYRFDLLAQCLYEFVWNEYCDWYLELAKPVLAADNAAEKASTQYTLVTVLETILRLLHPIMPYITETLWQQLKPILSNNQIASIMLASYPQVDQAWENASAVAQIEWLKTVIIGIRTIRAEMNISPAKTVPVYFAKGSADDKAYLETNRLFLTKLAKISEIHWLSAGETAPVAATALAGNMEVLIPLAGLIDTTAELARLEKNLAKLTQEITRIEKKLANPNFTAKAPAEVVNKEQNKLAELQQSADQLQDQKAKLATLDR